jgi:hypothetical protein
VVPCDASPSLLLQRRGRKAFYAEHGGNAIRKGKHDQISVSQHRLVRELQLNWNSSNLLA